MASVLDGYRARDAGIEPGSGDGHGRWLGPALAVSLGLWAIIGASCVLLAHLV